MGSDRHKSKSRSKSKHKDSKRSKRSRSPDSDADVSKEVRRREKSHKAAQGVPQAKTGLEEEETNAYGDSNLDQKFFWRKKVEKDVQSRKVDTAAEARDRVRLEELDRVRQKRCAPLNKQSSLTRQRGLYGDTSCMLRHCTTRGALCSGST